MLLASLIAMHILGSGAAAPPPIAQRCAFVEPASVLLREGEPTTVGSKLLQVWEFEDAPVYWSQADPEGYGDFRRRAAASVANVDAKRLLNANPSSNNRLVAERADEWVKPATCLQKLLQQVQDGRLDTFTTPTEFAAFVLRSPDRARLKVFYYTVNQDGIGRVDPIAGPVAQAHSQGWSVLAGLHNHNFHPGDPRMNGAVAPSLPDAQFNLRFHAQVGLAEAWITNGLDTAEIPSAAFPLFEQAP